MELNEPEVIFNSIVEQTKEFFENSMLDKVVIGLSGGVDSALVAAIAVRALGSENVTAIAMPSRISSSTSMNLAIRQARALDIDLIFTPIHDMFEAFTDEVNQWYPQYDYEPMIYENLQARIRGVILFAWTNANPDGTAVFSTGNRTESLLGYCTIQGDTTGAWNPINSLYKTEVYELCNYINKDGEVILQDIIDRPPTAELSEGQIDEEAFGLSYKYIDAILKLYCDDEMTDINAEIDDEYSNRIINMVSKNKFKYRYYAPGPNILGRKLV